MNERKISLLENITVDRGASPNEEAIAKAKIAKYAEAISVKTKNPTEVYVYESIPLEEQQFRMKWEKLRRENRKKWGIK